eukprot:835159-Prorocentrum_minimum.AAC.1
MSPVELQSSRTSPALQANCFNSMMMWMIARYKGYVKQLVTGFIRVLGFIRVSGFQGDTGYAKEKL